MKKIVIIVMAVLMAAASSFGAIYNNASIMFPILGMGLGGRAQAMGNAYTAVADDPSAVYWNAAGLANITNGEIDMTYNKWFMDSFFGQVQLAYPFDVGVMGADVIYLDGGEITSRDEYGNETGDINYYNIGCSLAYGMKLNKNFSIGGAVKVISLSSGSSSQTGFAGDVSGLFKKDIFSAGLNIQNLGTSGGDGYSLPVNIKAGIAVDVLNLRSHDLLFAVGTEAVLNDAVLLGGGIEYVYGKFLALRIGYNHSFGESNLDGIKGITGGIGLNYGNISFDYAIMPYGDLGVTQRGTLSYAFGAPEVKTSGREKKAADASYNKALQLERKGETDKAIEKYMEVVSQAPGFVNAWKRMGDLYYKKRNKKETIRCFEKYMDLKPNDKKTADWLKKYKNKK